MPNVKTMPARVKAVDPADPDTGTGDGNSGIVEALVATYDVDSIGDRIVPGAFTKSLDQWAESGDPIPFIWSHMHDDIDAYLGDVVDAKETDDGLWIRAQIDMDDPKAAKAYRLIKGGRVRNYSFAYEIADAGPDDDGPGEQQLRELKLFEVGPTLIGMNQGTRTLAAKGYRTKLGRTFSSANEQTLRDIRDGIAGIGKTVDKLLAQLDADTPDDAPDDGDKPPSDKPSGAPSGAPSGTSSATQGDGSQSGEPGKAEDRSATKRTGKADDPMRADPLDDDLWLEIELSEKAGS